MVLNFFLKFICIFFVFLSIKGNAQLHNAEELTNQRIDDYVKLAKLGLSDSNIFEDLGNVFFLSKKFKESLFWYNNLKAIDGNRFNDYYTEIVAFAKRQRMADSIDIKLFEKWAATVKSNYMSTDLKTKHHYTKKQYDQTYSSSFISFDKDYQKGFFTVKKYIKPLKGIFSSKQPHYSIYFIKKIAGKGWTKPKELKLTQKYISAKHPIVSEDGSKLIFSSNKKGGFGKYDLHLLFLGDIENQIPLNLGPKLNSKHNEILPLVYTKQYFIFASDKLNQSWKYRLFYSLISQKGFSEPIELKITSDLKSSIDMVQQFIRQTYLPKISIDELLIVLN